MSTGPVGIGPSATAGLLAAAALGLVGSVHCLGMCGPLVTVYADRMDDGTGDGGPVTGHVLRQHLLFNLGRTASYALAGATLGAVGGFVFDVGRLASAGTAVRGVVGLAAGGFIAAMGIRYLATGSGLGHGGSLPVVGAAFQRVSGALVGRLDRLVDGPGVVGLGAMHGLLPCPLLYPAYLYAFATGSAAVGGLSLAALGLGTVPTLFAYGTAFGSLSPGRRSTLHRVLGAVFVVLALVPLANGAAAFGLEVPKPPLPMPWM